MVRYGQVCCHRDRDDTRVSSNGYAVFKEGWNIGGKSGLH